MDRRGTLITAVVLIAIGAYILLANLNVIPPYPITQLWPGIVVLVGILFWLGFIFGKDHDPGLAFVGTIVTLVGLFFFLFTFNVDLFGLGRVDWSDMGLLWPAFPLIVGIGIDVVGVRFSVQPDGSFGFTLDHYDPAWPLIIDPTLIYGTFAGGSSGDYARGIAVDAQGHTYIAGDTLSTDFLGISGQVNGSYDVIVLKLNATASDLDYGILIGGSSSDQGLGVAVDAQGEAYVTVDAESTDFPIVNARYPDRPADNHGVLLKFAANGDLAYSTWLPFGVGNSFSGHNVAVDSQNNVIVTGELYTAMHTARDLAVLKLNAAGTQTLLDKSWTGAGDVSSKGIHISCCHILCKTCSY